LHAADDQLRSSLLPINRKYPLDELLDAVSSMFYNPEKDQFDGRSSNEVNDDQIKPNCWQRKYPGFLCL
jgi:adenine C2-methylase RlmN of 23S rRNA A2503 and tRNA A37